MNRGVNRQCSDSLGVGNNKNVRKEEHLLFPAVPARLDALNSPLDKNKLNPKYFKKSYKFIVKLA